jgi:photosystem II stability/assembly factor-like uncharacterized protein
VSRGHVSPGHVRPAGGSAAGAVLALAMGALAGGGSAHANGRFPATNSALADLHNPQHLLAQATFGLLTTNDGGGSWRWICEQAIGYSGIYDPHVAFTADGALLVTTVDGLGRSSDGGCTFVQATGLPTDQKTGMLATHSTDAGIVLAAIEADPMNPGAAGQLFRSTDGGQSFTPAALPGSAMPLAGIFFETAKPDRALMVAPTATNTPILVTDDAGVNFLRVAVISEGNLRLVALGTAHEDQLYLARDGDQPALLTLDLDTVDFVRPMVDATQLTTTPGRINGVVETPGGTLLVATSNGVLHSSDGGMNWQTLAHPHAECLVPAGDGALACGLNFAYQEGYGLARIDDTATVTPLLQYLDIAGPVECPVGTPTHDSCGALFQPLLSNFVAISANGDGGVPIPDMPSPPSDAGNGTDRSTPPSSGCTVSTGEVPSSPAPLLALAVLLLGVARRITPRSAGRRRGRGPARCEPRPRRSGRSPIRDGCRVRARPPW